VFEGWLYITVITSHNPDVAGISSAWLGVLCLMEAGRGGNLAGRLDPVRAPPIGPVRDHGDELCEEIPEC
jgi:hypothetical protein